MRLFISVCIGVYISLSVGCQPSVPQQGSIEGTWRSLWQKDMTLELFLESNHQFKVMLTRPGQVHTNIGWYDTRDSLFLIKDSVDYPLPVCNIGDTGRYTFRIINDTLQFKAKDDKCERRSYALQLERFVRASPKR